MKTYLYPCTPQQLCSNFNNHYDFLKIAVASPCLSQQVQFDTATKPSLQVYVFPKKGNHHIVLSFPKNLGTKSSVRVERFFKEAPY